MLGPAAQAPVLRGCGGARLLGEDVHGERHRGHAGALHIALNRIMLSLLSLYAC
jgi:hypothetical protein